jgi:glyoxylase-like metal-dependent hydrolase (beta-lactamase superfamily II)
MASCLRATAWFANTFRIWMRGAAADWQQWLESLDRIEQLKPGFVVGGHGPVSRGDEISAAIASLRKVLRESIARGFSPTSSRIRP